MGCVLVWKKREKERESAEEGQKENEEKHESAIMGKENKVRGGKRKGI